jgi:aryl carrier-like protein
VLRLVAHYDGGRHPAGRIADLLANYRSRLGRARADAPLRLDLRTAPPTEPRAITEQPAPHGSGPLDYLRRQVAGLTGGGDVDADRGLVALGLDSLKLIELATRVRRDLHVDVPLPAYARAPSLRALAEDLLLRTISGTATARDAEEREVFLV